MIFGWRKSAGFLKEIFDMNYLEEFMNKYPNLLKL